MSVHLFLGRRTKSANYDTAFFSRFNEPIFARTFFADLTCQFLRVLLFAHLYRAPAVFWTYRCQFLQCFYFADFWHANLRDTQNGMQK